MFYFFFYNRHTRINELTYITITTLITMTKVSNIVAYKYHDNVGDYDDDGEELLIISSVITYTNKIDKNAKVLYNRHKRKQN